MADHKTTAAAIVAAFGVLLVAGSSLLDADPATQNTAREILSTIGTLATLVGLGGIGYFAKDK